jgi:8-oxo-dGTP pyrophosphatase MutT (NUDIX family)
MHKDNDEKHGLFHVAENIALFNPRGELLALRHARGRWLLAGGRANEGEEWRDVLDREVREETGITEYELRGIFDLDSWTNYEGPHYGAFFIGSVASDEIELSDEHTEYRWLRTRREVEELEWWVPKLTARALMAWDLYYGSKGDNNIN